MTPIHIVEDAPALIEVACRHCGWSGVPDLSSREFTNRFGPQRHVGAYCPKCCAWIKWLPQTPEVLEALADQLDVREAENMMEFEE